ncbi:ATP-binding protein [Pontibacter sp. G13]|uniref:sensor histidine kinase n=1 Tax=Pontibacter sp. G13 TaxID=3074898 RepID=UPI00288946C9|nr:ATP-binding protein [Pontibacter sp. G13]WNJ17842.1 type IV pili methyl-accepting chemotaxis transducer N-terminal domain-containing protein [Pontibacter sp. G13]
MNHSAAISSQSASVFKRLSRWYLIALSVIGVVFIASHALIQGHLDKQENDSRIVNVAGRQRMLSQRLSKEILMLTTAEEPTKRQEIKSQIKETLEIWTSSHDGLKFGSEELGLPGVNSVSVLKMFADIQPHYDAMVTGTLHILKTLNQNPLVDLSEIEPDMDLVLDHEQDFLHGMDKLVFQYDAEAKNKVLELRKVEYLLLFFALATLVVELLFIFRPTALYAKQNIQQLVEAEKAALSNAEEIRELYEVKEKSVQELRALNFAVDQAALFASIRLDGSLIYMSEKLKLFLGYRHKKPMGQFAEIMTTHEGEQQYLSQIIRTPRSTIWTGEVSITSLNGTKHWLELSIVPVNRSGIQQDYLILCSDISARKKTEKALQQLNEEKFEERFRLQKLRSLHVVEAQENERKRIARDMHDGIGQMLTALKFNLESVNPEKPERAREKITSLKQLASNLIKGVRIATFNLTPPELTDYGLPSALAKLCSELKKLTSEPILFENRTQFQGRFDPIVETNIYRITQEAVNNAIKYSEGSYILVTLSHSRDLVSIMVEDDGKGFDQNQVVIEPQDPEGTNLGLSFMRERVAYINGRLFIRSKSGEGTRITVNIPISTESKEGRMLGNT